MTTYSIRVKFRDTDRKEYHYLYDQPLEPGTIAVVETAWDKEDGFGDYSLVEVVRTLEFMSDNATAWIVDTIDRTKFDERQAKLHRAKQIKADLDRRMKELSEARKYEILNSDPAASALLKELDELNKE